MATIKAGKYRFNDVLDFYPHGVFNEFDLEYEIIPQPLVVTDEIATAINQAIDVNGLQFPHITTGTYEVILKFNVIETQTQAEAGYFIMSYRSAYDATTKPNSITLSTLIPQLYNFSNCYNSVNTPRWSTFKDSILSNWVIETQTITIPNDSEVSDEFAEWFTANTKRLSTITYNGSIIASLLHGQTATIKCKDMKMESDVVVEVAYQSGGGVIDLANIPEVDSIDNPTENSPSVVKYGGEIYILVKGDE